LHVTPNPRIMSLTPKKQKHSVEGAGFLLWKAGNAWQRHVRQQLKSSGITHVQFLLLDAMNQLEANGKEPSQTLLARTAGTDVMMTSKVIRTLEQAKLVARKENRKDGRAVLLQITSAGKKKLASAAAAIKKSDDVFFAKLVGKPHKFVANLKALTE
jgi:DNA-binding MarR family transcriptional regulator